MELRDILHKIISDNFNANKSNIPWDGMHDETIDKIMKIINKLK